MLDRCYSLEREGVSRDEWLMDICLVTVNYAGLEERVPVSPTITDPLNHVSYVQDKTSCLRGGGQKVTFLRWVFKFQPATLVLEKECERACAPKRISCP